MKNIIFVVLVGSTLAGCVYYKPVAVSSVSLGNKYEYPVKTAFGTSSAYYVLGLGPFGDDSLEAAVAAAKRQGPADSIVNVFVDRKLTCYPACFLPVVTIIDTNIFGTLVSYRKEDGSALMPPVEKIINANSADNIFAGIEKGASIQLIFNVDEHGEKLGKDGVYEFLRLDTQRCALVRPVGTGVLGRKVYCPSAIEKLLPV